nr:hypothetical protein [Tanacetum cinerariifolium]
MRHEAPPSPDYVPILEDPEHPPPLPEFVPEPVYSEFMPLEDEILLAEEQPLPTAYTPIVDSLGYIPESDLEEDPKEDPTDYPTNEEDDDDDDDGSSDDDEHYDDVKEDEEEEEHPALADSILPPQVHRTTARMSIPVQAPTPV